MSATHHDQPTNPASYPAEEPHVPKRHHNKGESVLKPSVEPETDAKAGNMELGQAHNPEDRSQAIDFVRQKLAAIYGGEPDAKQELIEAKLPGMQHSKHQQHLLSLQRSGKSTTEVQTDWHAYYQGLDDAEKREVWQEFYSQSAQQQEPQQPHAAIPRNTPHNANAIYPTPTVELVTTPTNIVSGEIQSTPAFDASEHATPSTEHGDERRFEHQSASLDDQSSTSQLPSSSEPHPDLGIKNPLTEHLLVYEDLRQPEAVRQSIQNTVGTRRKLQAKHHFKSLAFGLAFGGATLLVVMFSFFNEVVIAPFLQPNRTVSATPIIVSPGSTIPSDKDEVIIPKINVQIPLVFDAKSNEKADFEAALDRGVSHYPTTALPGEKGNASFFGHSSNNIFNPGKYKFAFVLLNELVPGDTFYINYKGVSYAYQVYDKKIVEPSAVEILNPVADKTATAMLVTCDPPGTSLHRLVIWGEQVTPNPNGNTAPAAATTTSKAADALPGNGKSLWSRVWGWATGN